jgi:hypothetical protein
MECFQDLYVGAQDMEGILGRSPIRQPSGEEDRLPTTEEVLQAVRKLKSNRAPGPDSLNAELIKVDDKKLTHRICKVIKEVCKTEKIPQQWKKGLMCPILKMDDNLVCENCRGITLLNTAYKVFSNLLLERLQPYVEKIVGSYHCAVRSDKSTSDQIHMFKQIMEETGECGVSTFYLFVDFKAAYDSNDRNELFKAVEEFSLPRKLRLMEATSENKCTVKTQKGISDPFVTRKGLRQSDVLSYMLFNIALDKAVRVAGLDIRGTTVHKSVQILTYADDTVIIGRYEGAVKEAFIQLETAAKQMGLMINYDKTQYMELSNSPTREKELYYK